MKVISLGWGVQSFTLVAMAALGETPLVDTAIHADTGHESVLTYRFAERWTPWLEERGVRVVTVHNMTPVINKREVYIPAFTDTGGKGGILRRQCTGHWKIQPMRRWIQANRNREPVEQWLGISLDEAIRIRMSDVKYITNHYPLVERNFTRKDCVQWLGEHGLEVPPKSACTFCPYHSSAEWKRIMHTPEDRTEAIEIDRTIRKIKPPGDLYVHPSRKPLETIDFRTAAEKGQLSLWDEECSGICGV